MTETSSISVYLVSPLVLRLGTHEHTKWGMAVPGTCGKNWINLLCPCLSGKVHRKTRTQLSETLTTPRAGVYLVELRSRTLLSTNEGST